MSNRDIETLVICGSGPAAWTAAIYAARASLAPMVLEGDPEPDMIPGGQLMFTTEVENFPGFPDGITGVELMDRMRAQALRFGVRVESTSAASVDFENKPFVVQTTDGRTIKTRSLIVATGARPKWLGVPNEERLARSGGGVSACATCDGWAARDRRVAVVGGGDTAMTEALHLAHLASEVFVLCRQDRLKASRILADRAMSHDKIRFLWNTQVVEVLGEKTVEGVVLEHTVTKERSRLPIDMLFVAIGHKPNTDFLNSQLRLDAQGYIWTEPGSTQTSVPGVFAAGDVMDPKYRQAITAAATGCMAALDAEAWLARQGR